MTAYFKQQEGLLWIDAGEAKIAEITSERFAESLSKQGFNSSTIPFPMSYTIVDSETIIVYVVSE